MNNHLDYDTLEFVDTYSGIQFKDRAGNQSPGVMFGAIRINGELSPLYVPKDYIEGSLTKKKESTIVDHPCSLEEHEYDNEFKRIDPNDL